MVQKWERVGKPTDASESHFGKKLVRQVLKDPKGQEHEFYFYALKDSCVVIAVTTDSKVLTVKEYKQGADVIQQGLVGGYCDKGEGFADAARREVREETGHKVGTLYDLGNVTIISRHSSGRVQLFLAKDCVLDGEQTLDDSEGEIEVIPVPLHEWIARAQTAEVTDIFSIAATMRALPFLDFKVKQD